MSLFDNLAGQAMNALNQSGGSNNLMQMALQLVNQHGGIQGLVQKFSQGGLGDVVQSWVSTGQNLPVSPQQITQVLGQADLGALAQGLGVSPDAAAQQLSGALPDLVDKLTPNGAIEGGDLMQQGMALLAKLGK